MRDPAPSEPNSTFPTYQVPQASAMRGRAPLVQVAWDDWGARADPPKAPRAQGAPSVISGSSCHMNGNSNLRMQSVTDNCLLNSVTVPKIQRNDQTVTHNNNNSDKLECKFGALLLGQDIPNQKSDDLENDLIELNLTKNCDNETYRLSRLVLRLRGGGESSLSTGTSGWGTPPSQQASSNNANNSSGWGSANTANPNSTGAQQWGSNRPANSGQGLQSQDANKSNANLQSNGQQPPASQSNWGPGNKQTPSTSSTNTNASTNSGTSQPNPNPAIPATNSTKQQLEQLTSMREAIFSHDGWGGHINQDSNWDIPGSPEPPMKMDGTTGPPWKPQVNNGTELWEANLRNGGQPPPQPQQKTPWGHTPSTNIGGTWGEDDDVADSSNVWTGVPSAQQQWGGGNGGGGNGGGGNGGAMWGTAAPKKENDWTPAGTTAGWGDPRTTDPRAATIDSREMRADPREMRTTTVDPMCALDPREQMRLIGGDMRGDPRGITGRLNGAGAEAFWQAGPQAGAHHMHHQGKMTMGPGGSTTGWEEPSPPSQRRNVPNYDDGTSLWGNPQQDALKVTTGSHWTDLPSGGNMGRGNVTGPPGMAQTRIKPDGSVWATHGRNGSWDEIVPIPRPSSTWEGADPWPKQKLMRGPIWEGGNMDWNPKQGPKQPLTKEMVWNSKQFRVLVDMGYKKEDVENALRLRDMNLDDALDMLSSIRAASMENWRRHEEHYDHPSSGQFPGQRFPSGPTGQMAFPPGGNAPNLLNNMNTATAGGNNSLINNMSPAIVQKMLAQSGSQGFGAATNAGRTLQPQSGPSSQQLRMLVQQIQMAVQAGYLNHQILNQPLAPQTLVLLNQLLQQIKNLQQLTNQQTVAQTQSLGGKPNAMMLQCSVLITKTKQQISNLQNQIAAQQAVYVKQQQQHIGGNSSGPSDLFKSNSMHDSINALPNNFADLGIKDSQTSQPQSRLNQWKLPTLDKEEGDFSRAPGSSSKPLVPSHSSPNLNPLGLTQPDGPWSSGRSGDTGGWPETGVNDTGVPDNKDDQWPAPNQPSLTDLVPEFEPGKPWKGTQMKSIEDDPSITPGSVVRSPLSIAAIKDTELFSMNPSKSSPPGGDSAQPFSLSSSTWSFNPPAATPSAFTSPQNKLPATKGALGDLNPSTAVTSELWGAPKSRGPPPGLAKGASAINGWSTNLSSTASWSGQRNSGSWGSPWLLLRNLTAQIDGSTLRTLCMQHGPLQSFHLYLHQGFALAKYSTREEAAKAQTALNNCVLGNTTILAENPTDWDAGTLLQHVASQQASSNTWRNSGKPTGTGGDTWSTGWANNATTASLWGSTALDTADQARATPSSLNSFLPGDLLGGESM